jgi:hypothetical protein
VRIVVHFLGYFDMSRGKCARVVTWYGLSTNFDLVFVIVCTFCLYRSNYLKYVLYLCLDLGMIWMGDMLLPHESNEMMLDSQSGSPIFTDSSHPLEDMRNRVPLVSGNTVFLKVV